MYHLLLDLVNLFTRVDMFIMTISLLLASPLYSVINFANSLTSFTKVPDVDKSWSSKKVNCEMNQDINFVDIFCLRPPVRGEVIQGDEQ